MPDNMACSTQVAELEEEASGLFDRVTLAEEEAGSASARAHALDQQLEAVKVLSAAHIAISAGLIIIAATYCSNDHNPDLQVCFMGTQMLER